MLKTRKNIKKQGKNVDFGTFGPQKSAPPIFWQIGKVYIYNLANLPINMGADFYPFSARQESEI